MYRHGEATAKVLARHDEAAGRERIAAMRRRVGRERLNTLTMMVGSMITDHTVTVALTWGAVKEWTTQADYLQLAERSGHRVLGELPDASPSRRGATSTSTRARRIDRPLSHLPGLDALGIVASARSRSTELAAWPSRLEPRSTPDRVPGRAGTSSAAAVSAISLGATLIAAATGAFQRIGLTVVDVWIVTVAALVATGRSTVSAT